MLSWHCCLWCSNETLWEMLIWGQWGLVLYFWVSWCFYDAVAPDVQMRHCGKCWFEGNEDLFFISESPDGFCDAVSPDVQMRLCGKCWFEGNEALFFMLESPYAFVMLLHLMFKWDIVGNVDLRAMRPCSLFLSLLMLLWCCCTWSSNETLWEMLIWGQWDHVLYIWVSWCFCDTVAPDVQMRHCGKCWFDGNESLF